MLIAWLVASLGLLGFFELIGLLALLGWLELLGLLAALCLLASLLLTVVRVACCTLPARFAIDHSCSGCLLHFACSLRY